MLIETALSYCDPGGGYRDVSLDADFDEDRARFLLRSRGTVDVNDFLDLDDDDNEFADEVSDEVCGCGNRAS